MNNSDYFGEFIVLKELNLSLNLESIPELSKVFIEYNWEYSLEDSIKVYHYDYTKKYPKNIQEIELIKDENCVNERRMCKAFFRKIDKDLKSVTLRISKK